LAQLLAAEPALAPTTALCLAQLKKENA
jgi:hypothetical protein